MHQYGSTQSGLFWNILTSTPPQEPDVDEDVEMGDVEAFPPVQPIVTNESLQYLETRLCDRPRREIKVPAVPKRVETTGIANKPLMTAGLHEFTNVRFYPAKYNFLLTFLFQQLGYYLCSKYTAASKADECRVKLIKHPLFKQATLLSPSTFDLVRNHWHKPYSTKLTQFFRHGDYLKLWQ